MPHPFSYCYTFSIVNSHMLRTSYLSVDHIAAGFLLFKLFSVCISSCIIIPHCFTMKVGKSNNSFLCISKPRIFLIPCMFHCTTVVNRSLNLSSTFALCSSTGYRGQTRKSPHTPEETSGTMSSFSMKFRFPTNG